MSLEDVKEEEEEREERGGRRLLMHIQIISQLKLALKRVKGCTVYTDSYTIVHTHTLLHLRCSMFSHR